MAKQDWNAGDTLSRAQVNRPFFIASGVYNSVAGQIELYIGPGRMRFPIAQLVDRNNVVVYSGQTQQFVIPNPAATTAYSISVRPGATTTAVQVPRFMVSGSSLTDFRSGAVNTPRFDAEPIGTIYTGASLATANLVGPWNAGAFDPWDQRGEAPAVSAARPRMIYRSQSTPAGSIPYAGATNTVVSGIAHLHFQNNTSVGPQTFISAVVRYMVSGKRPGNDLGDLLYCTPTFHVRPIGGNQGIIHASTHVTEIDQDPDNAVTRGARQQFTATLANVDRGSGGDGTGFSLYAGFLNAAGSGETDAGVSIRILHFDFLAIPGFQSSVISEPRD